MCENMEKTTNDGMSWPLAFVLVGFFWALAYVVVNAPW